MTGKSLSGPKTARQRRTGSGIKSGMELDEDSCFRALRARDRRFDGVFFVGVTTTGIYCRPICPARAAARARCRFFDRAAEAERDGFRACLRCRPELAPGLAPADSVPRLVRAAMERIEAGALNDGSVDDLARSLGVTARHLRRAMEAELGVGPIVLAEARRLALAKQLLQDTAISLTDVAFGAGFRSVRRFNALFKQRFGRPPTAIRRAHAGRATSPDVLTLQLDYRPPLDWDRMIRFLSGRAIPSVEAVEGIEYRRVVAIGGATGWISVAPNGERPSLSARISLGLVPQLPAVVARLRALFDLDARPDVIAAHLGREPLLAPLVRRAPGLRVPGAFDPFETSIRAVLGQQVSVRAATTLAGRLVAAFGNNIAPPPVDARISRCFPSAAALAAREDAEVAAIGVPLARARTIVRLARAIDDGRIDLRGTAAPDQLIERLTSVPGIGPWTANYLAMRALHWPDAFPAGDLGLKKALRARNTRAVEERGRAWQPWRAYATMHIWNSLQEG
jgi:AraC family transcriptional regulator of adaptative response / DNA-3-methyladenine glycosylase II